MKIRKRVLLVTRQFRLVLVGCNTFLEKRDGLDRMGVQRWREADPLDNDCKIGRLADQIGDALLLRAKRQRRARKC